MLSHVEMILRILIGAGLGGIIGFERDIHGRQVGLRTHLLVSMASATFMVISSQFFFFQHYGSPAHVEADVSRVAASVVSGIGFLAGGAILKTGATIQGLTTAAALWLVTAIGLASGAGMFVEAGAVTVLGLIALTVLRLFEDKNDHLIHRHVSLLMADSGDCLTRVTQVMESVGARISNMDYEKRIAEKKIGIQFHLRIPVALGVDQLVTRLEKEGGMEQIHIKVRG
ncbi:MAG TPA: MgtC/SapB family protein [Bdellovibrionota bacterium]|jgi:putative Mg2+ transporter-C (MgtC) family protein|nr:MgtC/SapB family protein [Bdellovibrionota bacterium]